MRRYNFLLPLALAGTIAACDSDAGGLPDTAKLTIMLTDAPGDFSAAVVTISSIYLQGDATDDNPNGRVILSNEVITTDLLTLANDVETLVDDATVSAGTYGQLRFVIDGAYIEVETAQGTEIYATPGYTAPGPVTGELKCPSCGSSGIKVHFPGGLTLDSDETLLVDFDVSETFGHEAGNSGKWIMHPSLKGAPIQAAATVNASINLGAGVVLPILNTNVVTLADFSIEMRGANAEAGAPGESVTLTDANTDGTFEANFGNVVAGSYILTLKGPAGLSFGTNPAIPFAVTVQAGGTTNASFTLVSATATN